MFRFFYILFLVFQYLFLYLLTKLHLIKKKREKLFRSFFEDASGTFIKVGQLLALRVDILPSSYALEMLELLENVPPFSYEDVKMTFLQELGATPEKIFSDFQEKPFASASFSQVHAAKLADGTVVAVKVLRPHAEEKVRVDFFIIDVLAFFADLFFKIEALPWRDFAKEFQKWTLQELDYHIEAEHTQQMSDNLKNDTDVRIPKVYYQLSTKRILTQEYLDGIHLTQVLHGLKDGRLNTEKLQEFGVDLKLIPKTLVHSLLRQYFFFGFFHADLHPGNIILLKNNVIGLIDFGIVGNRVPGNQASFIQFLQYDAKAEFKEAAYYFADFAGEDLRRLITSAFPASVGQKYIDAFLRMITDHFTIIAQELFAGSKQKIKEMKKDYAELLLQLLKAANRYGMRVPSEAVELIRTLSIIDILAKQLDESFSIGDEIQNFFKKYPPPTLLKDEKPQDAFHRITREKALEELNSWLSRLIEKDPPIYQLVKDYITRYNIPDL